MQNPVKTLVIRFGNELHPDEIDCFRGAVVHAMDGTNVLFHNHLEGNKLRYNYPLIQYKRIHRKAAIVCVGEGTEAIGEFFAACKFKVWIGERPVTLEVESVRAHQTRVQVWQEAFTYRIRKWLPLNAENYEKYRQLQSDEGRFAFLDRMITGNILSFASGLGIHFDENVWAKITSADEPRIILYKGVKMMAFDAEFRTNVLLPDYVGIGKGVSLGMGTVVRNYDATEPNKVFLLGGHDLEMMTIKEMVAQQSDCLIVDRNLAWDNANLSKYKDIFAEYPGADIYAVELQEDMEIPEVNRPRYHRVDHHNDYAHMPSSLEQVAAVLGVELNRYQRLIAANDSGYIPAMKALMATDEEISDIRRQDRTAQGVTEEDEKLADESIAKFLQKGTHLWIVKSLTSKFSAICDRLYPYPRLLVYTDSEWMYYGEGKTELVQQLAGELEQKKVFHGGGQNGYVGAVREAFSPQEILEFVTLIKQKYE